MKDGNNKNTNRNQRNWKQRKEGKASIEKSVVLREHSSGIKEGTSLIPTKIKSTTRDYYEQLSATQ